MGKKKRKQKKYSLQDPKDSNWRDKIKSTNAQPQFNQVPGLRINNRRKIKPKIKTPAPVKKKKKVQEKKKVELVVPNIPYKENVSTPSDLSKKVAESLQRVVGEEEYKRIDPAIIHYLSTVLEYQVEPRLARPETELIKFLKKFFVNLGFSEEIAKLWRLYLQKNKIIPIHQAIPEEDRKEVTPLKTSIMFERTLEEERVNNENYASVVDETDYKSSKIGGGQNYNEELDWDEEKMRQLEEKRNLKKQKLEFKRKKEYEEYVRESGLSKKKGYVRLHRRTPFQSDFNIYIDNLCIGSSQLLNDTRLVLNHGQKYGLTGRNGVGKTTLLRGLVERAFPDIPIEAQILHVEQEVEATSDLTPVQCLLQTDIEREELLKAEEEILSGGGGDSKKKKKKDEETEGEGDGDEEEEDEDDNEDNDLKLQKIYDRMNDIDAHLAESKVREILYGLSFTPKMQETKIKHLSGGWRKRVSIARALFIEPDVLMMDEPENHLDLHALIWLENYLKNLKRCILVLVSHSKDFLNSIAQSIIHFHEEKLEYYRGDYYTFEKLRRSKLLQNMKEKKAHEMQKQHIQSFIDKFRYKAGRASLVQSRIKALKKMGHIPTMVGDSSFEFQFPKPKFEIPGNSNVLLQAINLTFGYDKSNLLFQKSNFILTKDSRIAIVGENGIGKSTFIKCLCGILEPNSGEVQKHPQVEIAVFSQHHANALDLSYSPLEYLKKGNPKIMEPEIRSQLGRMGLGADKHLQPIYTLSGGEKSRVVFAQITIKKPNIMFLDEPSNHLDLDTIDALISAVNDFEGPVVIISHDSYLIKRTCDNLFVIKNKKVNLFKGDFDRYKQQILV